MYLDTIPIQDNSTCPITLTSDLDVGQVHGHFKTYTTFFLFSIYP